MRNLILALVTTLLPFVATAGTFSGGGVDTTANITWTGNHTFDGTGVHDFDGAVGAPSFTADASVAPTLTLDSDSTYDGEGKIAVGWCTSAGNCEMFQSIDVGGSQVSMVQLEGLGGTGYLVLGGNTAPGTTPTDYILVTSGGDMEAQGAANLIADKVRSTNASPVSTDCDEVGERGEIYIDGNAASGAQFYVCAGNPAAWVTIPDDTHTH